MNLKKINDQVLIKETENLAREERELLTKVLQYLQEIDRRRLYSSLGYKSLFEFTTKRLGYSEDQAYRRISAMRLLREVPEIEDKITTGEINLTHIGLAQSLFKNEKKSVQKNFTKEEKLNVFEKIAHLPTRQAERVTLSLSSTDHHPCRDKIKNVSPDLIELKFEASLKLRSKIERLKGLIAHKDPNISLGELFENLCDLGLEQWDPATPSAPRKRRVTKSELKLKSKSSHRREIFKNSNGECENCKSTYALEIDHIIPKAHGGGDDLQNLRLLCRSCNQRSAVSAFGADHMQKYLRRR